ncbi:hypothetical protein ScPMuIL_005829 [Solemya velum]
MASFVDDWQSRRTRIQSNRYMLIKELACDVTFLVGKLSVEISAHKFILVSRSCVFYAMLCGPLAEKPNHCIRTPDIEPAIFKLMLQYLYCEDAFVDSKNAQDMLYAAKKYSIQGLIDVCIRCLESTMNANNVCSILEQAYFFDELELKRKCLEFIFHQPKDVIMSSAFNDLTPPCLMEVVRSDELDAKEESIFEAVLRWADNECIQQEVDVNSRNRRSVLGRLLYFIRFPLMEPKYFREKVCDLDLLTSDEKSAVIQWHSNRNRSSYLFSSNARSLGENIIFHWRYGPVSTITSESTAISFSASTDVLIDGVVMYSSSYEEDVYDVTLSVHAPDNKQVSSVTKKLDIKKQTPSYEVTFVAASKLTKRLNYTIIVKVQRSGSYYGASGRSTLAWHGVKPTVINPGGGSSKTAAEKEQIPGLLVRPCETAAGVKK